jgi:hypothetical protein
MRNLIVHLSTGYCGMDAYDVLAVPEDLTDRQIDEEVWMMACQHAENYGYPEADFEDEEVSEEEYHEWMSNHVDYWWEDYEPERHDMYRSGGGSFSEDFN